MNKKVFLICLVLTSSFSTIFNKNKKLKGIIEAPAMIKKIPNFPVFYLGTQTNTDDDGFYTLPHKLSKQFSILISRNLYTAIDKKNTVKGYKLIKNKPYKYFRSVTDEENNVVWKEFLLSSQVIPDNTVIIRMDPKMVKKLEPWDINLPSNFVKLPKVILKNNVTLKELSYSSNKAFIYSLDEKPFHQPVEIINQTANPKTKIALAQ